MQISVITPYLTLAAPLLAAITMLDYVVREDLRIKFADRVFSVAKVGTRTLGLASYGLVVASSLFFTLLIISVNGGLRCLQGEKGSMAMALKSSGPLLLGIALKITLWDYLAALKSFAVWESSRQIKSRKGRLIATAILVSVDLYFTSFLTSGILNWFDLAQSNAPSGHPQKGIASFFESIANLFNAMNFFLKESIQKSFYVLNGSLVFYLSVALSWVARGAMPLMDISMAKKNIFKILAAVTVLMLFVILVSFWLAGG